MNLTPKQEFKKFLRAFIIILFSLVLSDQLIGRALKYFYFKQQSGLLYRTTYSIYSTMANCVVVGSSRANHNYDPHVFESKLKTSFYNCGRDKQGLLYSCAIVSAILKRYSPGLVIIDIRPDEFSQSDEGSLATLFPYADNSAILPYIKFNSNFENIKFLSKIYPYNSLLTNIISGQGKDKSTDYKGYVKLSGVEPDNNLETANEKPVRDTVKIFALKRLLDQLKGRQINTLLIISPIHYNYRSTVTLTAIKQLQQEYSNVKFLSYLNNNKWQHNIYYSDNNHLNASGAKVFSETLSDIILRDSLLNR